MNSRTLPTDKVTLVLSMSPEDAESIRNHAERLHLTIEQLFRYLVVKSIAAEDARDRD